MTAKKQLIIMSLMLFVVSACSITNEEQSKDVVTESTSFVSRIESTSDRDKLPFAIGGGINLGLYNLDGNIEETNHFKLQEEEPFEKYISIGNLIDQDRIYKLLLFVDYQQHQFSVDNRELAEGFTFEMKAGETLEIPVNIPPMENGLHDILFVIVKYPDNKSLEEEFRKRTDMNHLLFLHYSAVVGGAEIIPYEINFNEFGTFESQDLLDGIFVSKEDNYKRWLTEDVKENELDFITKVGNNGEDEKTYAVISLLDWNQVNIIKDHPVLYYKLQQNEAVTIDSQVSLNEETGVYDFTQILIQNPFQKLENTNGVVETGIRVGINKEE